MKTNDIMKAFCLTALAIGVASCQNDEIESNSTTVATQDSQIRVSCTVAGGVESRAMVELNNEDTTAEYFQWNEGDSFTLYDIGSDGVTTPTDYTTFTISDYSDDDPSAYADFVGTGTLTEGNQVLAIYPAQGEISSSELILAIDYEALMGKVYADYQEYMSSQMYMYATAQVDDADSGLELEFNHLTCMARITCTNHTDEEQSIEYVDFRGDGKYIGHSLAYDFEEGAFSVDFASYFTQQYYYDADLTVAPGDSVDLYLLFFPGNEFADDGTLTITIDYESVEMNTSDFPHTSFQAGYRYWFNVAKTDDGLIWTKDYVDESGTDTSDDDDDSGYYITSADWLRFDYDSDWQLIGWGDDDYYYWDVSYDPLYMEGSYLGNDAKETTILSDFGIDSDGYITKFSLSSNYSGYEESTTASETYELTYNSSGQLTKVTCSASYTETYDGDTFTESGSSTYTFTWSSGVITSWTYSASTSGSDDYEWSATETGTFDYGSNAYANSTKQYVMSTAEHFWGDYIALPFLGYFGIGTAYLPEEMSYVYKETETYDGETDTYSDSDTESYSYGFNDNGTVNWENWDGDMVYYTYSSGSSSTTASTRSSNAFEGESAVKAKTCACTRFMHKASLRHSLRGAARK